MVTMTKLPIALDKGFLLLISLVSLVWIKSAWGKWVSGNFVETLGGTLTKMASKNPNLWFKNFLETVAIPNATIFGWLTILGETFAGVGSILAIIYLLTQKPQKLIVYLLLLALATGAFLNTIFWLASGYMSAAIDSLNLLMIGIQLVSLIYIIKALKK